MSPFLSVIVSTYDSPAWMEKVLWGYVAQTRGDFELLVADDGSSPETARLLERFRDSGLALRHVWQPDRGFRKCRVLNKAVEASQGEYLVFSDGDCIPRADFLAVHAGMARRGRFLSGGCARLSRAASLAVERDDVATQRVFSPKWVRDHGGCGLKATAKLAVPRFAASVANRLTTTRPTWNGGNASGWRDDVIAANGFDERMGYGGEDREFGLRLENAGVRGTQVRYRAVCVHLDHDRGYVSADALARNKAIRQRTRSERRTRTAHGIRQPGDRRRPRTQPDRAGAPRLGPQPTKRTVPR